YHDLVLIRKEGHAPAQRVGMERLGAAKGGNRDRSVEDVSHLRPWSRSSTAEISGSAALNSSTNAKTLRLASASGIGFEGEGVGAATSTGTMAAAGLPCRRITVRLPRCSARLTSSEMRALASASDILRMVTNIT